MSMDDFVILTDSCCDMTAQMAADLELEVLPLSLNMGDQVYHNYLDGREIGFRDFYAKLRSGALATTSAISVGVFDEAMRKILDSGRDVLYLAFSSALSTRMFGPTNEDILWSHQYKVITALAEKGPCVIVGRCADYILQDKADCLKVFIHADMKFRAERIVKEYGERDQSPEERLKDKDKRRAAYHRFYTDMKWGHAQNYHITLDSGALGIDKCVDILVPLF